MPAVIEQRVVLHCPVCQYQYADGAHGAPTRCPNGPAVLLPGGRTAPWKYMGHGEASYVLKWQHK